MSKRDLIINGILTVFVLTALIIVLVGFGFYLIINYLYLVCMFTGIFAGWLYWKKAKKNWIIQAYKKGYSEEEIWEIGVKYKFLSNKEEVNRSLNKDES